MATLSFLGDVFIGERWEAVSLSADVHEILARADLVIANLEGPVCGPRPPAGTKCSLCSARESAQLLRRIGVDIVSLANNHMLDYGLDAVEETKRLLRQAGIRYLGAGRNVKEASAPLIVEVRDCRFGFLAYAWDQIEAQNAGEDSPGCAPLDADRMVEQVRDLVPAVDAVVVLPHWGYCDYRYPLPRQLMLAGRLFQAGAAAVIGSHSHVVQGIVDYEDHLVAYSLGDFLFAPFEHLGRHSQFTSDNLCGAILDVVFSEGRFASYAMHLTKRHKQEVKLDDAAATSANLERLSGPLRSTPAEYGRFWKRVVRQRLLSRLLYWADPRNWRKVRAGTLNGGWIMLRNLLGRRGRDT